MKSRYSKRFQTILPKITRISAQYLFSFLAGFWRNDYSSLIATIKQPTLVVLGESASSISKEGKTQTADDTLADYLAGLPQGRGVKVPGRNVLPYESTAEFVKAIAQSNL